MPTIEELAEKYKTGKIISPVDINIDDLANKYRVDTKSNPIITPTPTAANVSTAVGMKQGLKDIGEAVDPILQPTVGKLFNMLPKDWKGSREEFEKDFGNDPYAQAGRVGSQIAATAPMVPAGGIRAAFGAMPIITSTGERIAAPAMNRLGATIGTGLVGGGVFGVATNKTNEEGLASNIASNAATGAVGAPIVAGAGKLGAMAVPAIRSLKANLQVMNAARSAGLPPSAIKNVVGMLEESGLTPDQARLELNRLGSKATLGDLDPTLQAEISGLSQLGGKPTSILRNRYQDRAEGANNEASQLINRILGPKPDLNAERETIIKNAQKLTGPDYRAAKASGVKLDLSSLVSDIDDRLIDAVGSKASALKTIKGYLFKDAKDAQGNVTKVLKTDVGSLHEIRQALDDTIDKMKAPATSQGKNTLGAVKSVRNIIDTQLKTVPEMAAADAKFAEHMKVAEGLQIGYDALTKKINKEEFAKVFSSASPEMQDTIRKGLRAAIGDVMESASQGEGSAAQRLFNKKTVNKEILKTAFGGRGENVIDTIHDEIAQRGTERMATSGSQTALNQAIRRKYEGSDRPHLSDLGLSTALDAYGAGGTATAAMIVKRGVTNRLISMSENKLGRLTEGTADLLSRQGAERNAGINVIDQVNKIQNRLAKPTFVEGLKLPRIPTLAPIVGDYPTSKIKEKIQ